MKSLGSRTIHGSYDLQEAARVYEPVTVPRDAVIEPPWTGSTELSTIVSSSYSFPSALIAVLQSAQPWGAGSVGEDSSSGWLQDLLPTQLLGARIMTFTYSVGSGVDILSVEAITQCAHSLLEELLRKRQEFDVWTVVFAVPSLRC